MHQVRDFFGKWEAKEGNITKIFKTFSLSIYWFFAAIILWGKKDCLGIETSIVLIPEMKAKAGRTIPRE